MFIDLAPYGYLEVGLLIRLVLYAIFFFFLGIIVVRAKYPLSRFERSLGWFALVVSLSSAYMVGVWLYLYFFTSVLLV